MLQIVLLVLVQLGNLCVQFDDWSSVFHIMLRIVCMLEYPVTYRVIS